jgi:superfamily II DNA or RNA helicase
MQRGIEERPGVVLDEAKLAALHRSLARFSGSTRERGERYARAGRVGEIEPFEGGIAALVRGTKLYETAWDWGGGVWRPLCTCPVGGYCKHAYALARRALMGADFGASSGSAEKATARSTGRSPSLLDRLRAAKQPWTRRDLLLQILRPLAAAGVSIYRLPVDEILLEPDPDLLCWRLVRVVDQIAPQHLPLALVPYRARADLAEAFAARERAQLFQELVQWAERRRAPTGRSLRLLFSLARAAGQPSITLEARLTSPRLDDEPRSLQQLQQLRGELRRAPDLLPPDQASALEVLADGQVEAVGGYSYRGTRWTLSGRGLKTLGRRVAGAEFATWAIDIDRALAARGGIEPGGPFRMRDDSARLLPTCLGGDGETLVDLAFVWPDGKQRALADVLHLPGVDPWESRAQPSFVLADGELSVVSEEPAPAMIERFAETGPIPIPRAERGELLGLLASRFPHLHETVAARTRVHAVRPIVALDLRDDDWLQVRLLARGESEEWRPGEALADGAIAFEFGPDARWVRPVVSGHSPAADREYANVLPEAQDPLPDTPSPRSAGDGATREEIWIEAPDADRVEPGLRWLRSLPLAPGTKGRPGGLGPDAPDRDVGWWMQVSARGMAALAEAWESRPAEVTFFGTPRVRRLLSGEVVLRPRLHIAPSGIDWFSISAQWEGEGLRLTDGDLAKLRSATTPFVKLSSGWVRRETAREHDEAAEVFSDLGVEIGAGPQRLSLWQLAGASQASLAALERMGADPGDLRAAAELRERVARFAGLPRVPMPAGLRAELRPYQERGLDFLVYASSLGVGAVLADDMGLGKTIQALAWLEHLRGEDRDGGPSLVVCPASVVHNWAREAERFAPGLRVLLLTRGTGRRRLFDEIGAHDLVVTNYALLRRDIEAWREVKLRALILDEAQNLKNPDAVVTRAALTLEARHRLALTGTPLENRALDLWSIAECVNRGYLGARASFEARFDRLDAPTHVRTLLAAKLRPVLLRRTKKEVATDLPDRIEERIDCELTKEQRILYLDELRRSRSLVDRLAADEGGLARNKIHVLAALTRLRQICCHPALAGGRASLSSGKFEALFELLEPLLDEGHKVLLFSQFVECLKLIETELGKRGVPYHKLTGQTVKRDKVVAAFQNDELPCVFLVSLKAGGTGLNLTAASYVVLFDPWWNPAVEAQAIDRTHRIGQDRTVIAYRLLSRGTIEEKIWELQQRKAELARDILGEEGGFARALTRGDLDYLLAEV